MRCEVDVAVVGGGVIGLTAALAMAKRGFTIAIIDAGTIQPSVNGLDPRVYAINHASKKLLESLGAWQQLESLRISPYRHMYVWDAANGANIEFDAHLIAMESLGCILEEAILKKALLKTINSYANITLFPNNRVTAIDSNANSVKLDAQKQSWQCKLLMIADGANSVCRQFLGVPLVSWPYHQHALVALVNTEKPHQQTAYQVFNPDGPLAFLPLSNPKQCSIVWSTTPTRAKQLLLMQEENFNEALETAFASKLGQLQVEGKRSQFPLIMRHAKQYTGERWLLLGDAAHTIHPLAGLGLNVGLADVASWLTCFTVKELDQAPQKALSAYQRQRKNAVWQIIALMSTLKSLFANPLLPIVHLRGFGLKFSNTFSPLKRFFIEQATGVKLSN